MTKQQMEKFLGGIPETQLVGRSLKEELEGLIELIPGPYHVSVTEGGGPENLLQTLAVSIGKMARELE